MHILDERKMLKSQVKGIRSSPQTLPLLSWKNNSAFFQILTWSEYNPPGSLFIAFSKTNLHMIGLGCVFHCLLYCPPALNLVYVPAAFVREPGRESPCPPMDPHRQGGGRRAPEPGLCFPLGSWCWALTAHQNYPKHFSNMFMPGPHARYRNAESWAVEPSLLCFTVQPMLWIIALTPRPSVTHPQALKVHKLVPFKPSVHTDKLGMLLKYRSWFYSSRVGVCESTLINKLPGDANATGLWDTLWGARQLQKKKKQKKPKNQDSMTKSQSLPLFTLQLI